MKDQIYHAENDHMEQKTEEPEPPLALKLSRHGLPLLPQPSDDVFDPLNWSSLEKVIILVILCILAFLGTCHMIAIAPAFGATVEDFGEDFALTTYLVGAPLLSYGVASLVWVSIGNRVGVKKTFAGSMLVGGLLSIWAAKASSFGELVAARTLVSFFLASPETLGPQACGDVFFLKDRATVVGLFTASQGSGFSLGTLVGSFIVQNLGWRWIQWVTTILSLATSVIVVFVFPETQYTRDSSAVHGRQRTYIDTLRFWRVSGGGKPKVDSFIRAFLYPLRYLPSSCCFVDHYLLFNLPYGDKLYADIQCNCLSIRVRVLTWVNGIHCLCSLSRRYPC